MERPGKLRLLPWMGLRDALLAAFTAVLDHAAAEAARAASDPVRAVHEFRKSVRRGRSLLRLVWPAVDPAVRDEVALVLRAELGVVSALRDGDVLLSALAGLGEAPRHAEAVRRVRGELARTVRSVRESLDPAATLAASSRALVPLPERLAAGLPASVGTVVLERGLSRAWRRSNRALRRAGEDPGDETIHAWRKRVKELRYALELLERPDLGERPPVHRAAAALAEGLGSVTDLIVLRRHVVALAGQWDDAGVLRLAAGIEERIRDGFRGMVRLASPLGEGVPREVSRALVAFAREGNTGRPAGRHGQRLGGVKLAGRSRVLRRARVKAPRASRMGT
jgi:CHAD domain-containing protein